MKYYNISQARDRLYGAAAALTYWVFKSRDRRKSPAMGVKTWTFLESSILNASMSSSTVEDYLQNLCNLLHSRLIPQVLVSVVDPKIKMMRYNTENEEIIEPTTKPDTIIYGWGDMITDFNSHGLSEWELLELCRQKPAIIQVLCRFRFEEDKATEQDLPGEIIEVEAISSEN